MADASGAVGDGRSVDELTQIEQKAAALPVVRAAVQSLVTAVDFVERICLWANASEARSGLVNWIDPEVTVPEYIAIRDSAISDVLQASGPYTPGLAAKRKYYREQVTRFVAAVKYAAREWALDSLARETQRVFQLLTSTRPRIADLCRVARAVRARVDATRVVTLLGKSYKVPSFVAPTMTVDQAREVVGEVRTDGTISKRLRRQFYMSALRDGPRDTGGTRGEVGAYENLLTLMTHPRGVDIVDAFATSAEAGWKLASDLMSDSFTAIANLQGDLRTDETLVWRFPPAVSAGVARLGLKNRAGVTRFALAWGGSRKSKLDQALEIGGNCLFVLDLVGGPLGGAVSEILNFVLAAIGTAVSFMRDVEQDQAAAATAFAERSERLSEGSKKTGTVLQGLAAIVAGLALPGAVGKITGRKSNKAVQLGGRIEGRAPVAEVDPRGISYDSRLTRPVESTERGLTRDAIEPRASRRADMHAAGPLEPGERDLAKRLTLENADSAEKRALPGPIDPVDSTERGITRNTVESKPKPKAKQGSKKREPAPVSAHATSEESVGGRPQGGKSQIGDSERSSVGGRDADRALVGEPAVPPPEPVKRTSWRNDEWGKLQKKLSEELNDKELEIATEKAARVPDEVRLKAVSARLAAARKVGDVREIARLEKELVPAMDEVKKFTIDTLNLERLDLKKALNAKPQDYLDALTSTASRREAYKLVREGPLDGAFRPSAHVRWVEHVYPRSKIFDTPGFLELRWEQQVFLFNLGKNLKLVPAPFNLRRGTREYRSLLPSFWDQYFKSETDFHAFVRLEAEVEANIDRLVRNPKSPSLWKNEFGYRGSF
jgi:hypothetical protein